MNERIQELEKQAWEFVDKTWNWANANNPSQATLFKAKFAELIVKECAQVAFEGDLKRAIGQWGADSDILKHFGVEYDVVKKFRGEE
jgi:hypothetical protein